jgi:tetratricopeptide (TPR) repeat protein
VALDPLSLAETETLVARFNHGGSASKEFVDRLHRRSGGNPLLLVSFLGTGASTESSDIPPSIIEYYMPRLRALPRDALVILAALSLKGGSVAAAQVARIAGASPDSPEFAGALSELHSGGYVVLQPDARVALRHGVIGEVCIAALSPADGKALHARAARIFAKEGASPPAVLAVQHDIAGERAKAYAAAVNAAQASEALYATREREFFLKLALSNAPDSETDVRIRIDLANLLRHAGRPAESLEVLTPEVWRECSEHLQGHAAAARLAARFQLIDSRTYTSHLWDEIALLAKGIEPEITAELYYLLAAAAHTLGRAGDALAATRHALAIIQLAPPTPKNALIASRSAVGIGLYSGAFEGLQEIERFLPLASGNIETWGQFLTARATLLIAAGRLCEAETQFLESIGIIERCYLYSSLFRLHNNLGVCYTEQGRYSEARAQFELASRAGRDFGGPDEERLAEDNLAMLNFEMSNFAYALQVARAAAEATAPRSSRTLYYRQGIIGLCSLELGLLAQAFEAKREIDLLFDQHEYWSNDVSYVETFLARMLVLEDRVAAARSRLETAIEIYRPRDLMCRSRLELELARIDLKRDPSAALARAEGMLEVLRGTGARPLIDRFEEIADRARLQPA